MRILIVDDLGSARKVLKKLLGELGFTNITEADNGQAAYTKLTQEPFQLVISDWEMPKMPGIDLVKQIRQDEKLKALPFIMITSNNTKDYVLNAVYAGVSNYISKPFSSKVLSQKINEVFTKSFDLSKMFRNEPKSPQ